jgi:hypothetical protein
MNYPFTEAEMQAAADEWNANCGPSALAFALQIPVARVRGTIPGFEEKGYTSPSMMRAALQGMGVRFVAAVADREEMFRAAPALVRVQWTGPWTKPGANPKWAYRQTHWIAAWRDGIQDKVFDCNGGIRAFSSWETEIVPLLTKTYPRADGGWFPTHIWRLGSPGEKLLRSEP